VDAADEVDGRPVGSRRDLKRPTDRSEKREQEDGPMAEHLVNRGREIPFAATVEVVDEPSRDGLVVGQQLAGTPRPARKRSSRGPRGSPI
jgi:hypothetical protein